MPSFYSKTSCRIIYTSKRYIIHTAPMRPLPQRLRAWRSRWGRSLRPALGLLRLKSDGLHTRASKEMRNIRHRTDFFERSSQGSANRCVCCLSCICGSGDGAIRVGEPYQPNFSSLSGTQVLKARR